MKGGILILLASAALSAALCAAAIPILRRMKAGQPILGYVREHAGKGGTPTMGGVAFLLAAALCALAFGLLRDKRTAVAVALGTAGSAVGFLDDLLKLRFRRNLGLRSYQKIAFQVLLALIAGAYCYAAGITRVNVPFTHLSFGLGVWTVPCVAFVFLAASNCVNLTDGLDGLAASAGFWYFASFAALIALAEGSSPAARLCLALCGALAGYLLFNTYRASVFMGDTGSLGLGGYAAAVAALSGNLLHVAVVGVMFVCSGISVIVQVIYYKKTGRRFFRMAPLHHHFQQCGFAESKIAFAYSFVTAAAGLLCVYFLL